MTIDVVQTFTIKRPVFKALVIAEGIFSITSEQFHIILIAKIVEFRRIVYLMLASMFCLLRPAAKCVDDGP